MYHLLLEVFVVFDMQQMSLILLSLLFRRLATDFTIHFGVIHNIQIVQWPESIKLQVRYRHLTSFIDLTDTVLCTGNCANSSGVYQPHHGYINLIFAI